MKPGILLLSHCGFSFMEDLAAAARKLDHAVLILSSCPASDAMARLDALAGLADNVISTHHHCLTWEDVEQALASLRDTGWDVRACVSVWEGYRVLMARANAQLGVSDLSVHVVEAINDKFQLRTRLLEAGLTRIGAEPASDEAIERWLASGRAGFIKPRRGIASFGACRLRPGINMASLQSLSKEVANDAVYGDLLANAKFYMEDYIVGDEYSFEVIAQDGEPYLIGVHQKLELTETENTVLEDSCVSPPLEWDEQMAKSSTRWLKLLMNTVGADSGCFHIEARLARHGWELVEINPRVGGALISASVAVQTSGQGLLDHWLKLLLTAGDETRRRAFRQELQALHQNYPRQRATFFRVYFARPGKIHSIRRAPMKRQPDSIQCFLEAGTSVMESAREVFLGQALWSFESNERNTIVPELAHESAEALSAVYSD